MRTAFLIGSRLASIPLAFVPRSIALRVLDAFATRMFGPYEGGYESRTDKR